jgi:hypothetical protein
MADYSKAALDTQIAIGEFTSGSYDLAEGVLQAALKAENAGNAGNAGNAKPTAMTSDLNKFDKGNG